MRIATYQPQQICPDVKQLDIAAYEQGMWAFIRRFRQVHEGEAAIYQFGVVRTPGVSDIDLLIVTRDETWKRAIEIANKVIEDSERLRYLFVHPPVVVCESLVEHLPFLHTIDNCRRIDGEWDPLAILGGANVSTPSDDMRLIRHSMWNSFMRVASLEMDGKKIGLRRVLILLHNLLTSAKRGNRFLKRPLPISMESEIIREEVLATRPGRMSSLARDYIDEVSTLLNQIDIRLDQALGVEAQRPTVIPSRGHYLVAPLTLNFETESQQNFFYKKLLKTACVVPTPNYLIAVSSLIAQKLNSFMPEMNGFPTQDANHNFPIDTTAYTNRLQIVYRIFRAHDLPYSFVRPFSYHARSYTLKQQALRRLRQQALLQKARRWSYA